MARMKDLSISLDEVLQLCEKHATPYCTEIQLAQPNHQLPYDELGYVSTFTSFDRQQSPVRLRMELVFAGLVLITIITSDKVWYSELKKFDDLPKDDIAFWVVEALQGKES